MKPQSCASGRTLPRGRGLALALLVLALPLLLGAWKIMMNKGINPSYVERIEDGKTKKSEILTLFGDPQETKRLPEGTVFVYKTFKPKETPRRKAKEDNEPVGVSSVDSPYELEQRLKRKPTKEEPTEEISSMLTIYFKADGETVRSHEFKEF
jgi:hypothetical protein